MPKAQDVVLCLERITKRFGALFADDTVSLTLHSGKVVALLNESGAGKTTSMHILFGHYRADTGTVEMFGKPLAPGNPRAAQNGGVGMVHQPCTLADNLSVIDNSCLGTASLCNGSHGGVWV